MNKELLATLKENLEKEKMALTKELETFATQDKNIPGNWEANYPSKERGNKEEEADEAGEYENLLSLENSLEVRLKNVDSALGKIGTKAYGVCEKCGKKIEEDRLLAYPAAKTCMVCNK